MRRALLALFVLWTAAAHAADGWERARPEDVGLSGEKLAALTAEIAAGKFGPIGSVAIARHGKLVYEDYPTGDAATLRDTRSATKTVASLLIGIALDRHLLKSPATTVLSLLPDRAKRMQNPDKRKTAITVEDLLTMSSPLECDDWNDASRGNEERMYLVEDWTQFILDLPIRGRMRIGLTPPPPDYGRYFSYCTGGVFVLSEVLEKVSGRRTDLFAQASLFGPLGIGAAEWVYSPLGTPQTGGGLRLSAVDLLKIAQLALDGGTWHGQRIVSEGWIKESTGPHARIDDKTLYGYLWWIKDFSTEGGASVPAYYMSGNGGNKVLVFPSLDMSVVLTSTNFNTRGMHQLTEDIVTRYVLPAAGL